MNELLCVRRLTSVSLMEFDSSLGLTMTLHTDESFSSSYSGAVTMETEDTLFFQVTLQTNASFASDVLLRVESCWSTESTDPQDAVRGLLLRDGWVGAGPRRTVMNPFRGPLVSLRVAAARHRSSSLVPSCAVDDTFRWLSANGRARTSRFSIQMFSMPTGLPLYVHCRADVCGRDEDCTEVTGPRWTGLLSRPSDGHLPVGNIPDAAAFRESLIGNTLELKAAANQETCFHVTCELGRCSLVRGGS